MVGYKLIKGKIAQIKLNGHPIGEVESLILPENGVDVKGEKAFGAEMSGWLRALSLEGLYQQHILWFPVRINNKFNPKIDGYELEQLLKGLTINNAPMLKRQPEAETKKVLLDVSNIEMAYPNQAVLLQDDIYSLKNFMFKCDFKEKTWKD
jgi:hypothetical protein